MIGMDIVRRAGLSETQNTAVGKKKRSKQGGSVATGVIIRESKRDVACSIR